MAGQRASDRRTRRKLHSPGRPPAWQREHYCRFWQAIARGRTSEQAAAEAGISAPLGPRWFRSSGGMPPTHLAPSAPAPTGRCLSFGEREEIAIELASNSALRAYLERNLSDQVTNVEGIGFAGPEVIWKKRRTVLRQSRRWSTAWSPEQIAHRLRIDSPEHRNMRISHEAIYQSLYIQGRGALRRELTDCLRSGRALRVPREWTRGRGKPFVGGAVMISERPPAVEDRAIPGHWEGDLILGLHSSTIGTLVERSSRLTMLLHLPRQEVYQRGQGVKNGPPLAGHRAEAVRTAIVQSMSELPVTLRQSLTCDQRAEMAQHARLRIESRLEIYF